MHVHKILLGQFHVSLHRVCMDAKHQIPWEDQYLPAFSYARDQDRGALIFQCPIYYEVHGQFFCFFKESQNSISIFFRYLDQRCLPLFIREALGLQYSTLRPPPQLDTTKTITFFLQVLPIDRGTKRQANSGTMPLEFKSMRT